MEGIATKRNRNSNPSSFNIANISESENQRNREELSVNIVDRFCKSLLIPN